MIAENKIKGIYLLAISQMYFLLFSLELIDVSLSLWYIITFFILQLSLTAYSIHLLIMNRNRFAAEKYLVFFVSLILGTIILFSSGGIDSPYFPCLYVVVFSLGAFYNRTIYLYSTILGIVTVGAWILLFSDIVYFLKVPFILPAVVYIILTSVIQNYPISCIKCDLVHHTCDNQKNCGLSLVKRKQTVGVKTNAKFFKEG